MEKHIAVQVLSGSMTNGIHVATLVANLTKELQDILDTAIIVSDAITPEETEVVLVLIVADKSIEDDVERLTRDAAKRSQLKLIVTINAGKTHVTPATFVASP